MFNERRVLVTGGAGFIGSHLCERLLTLNYEILCVDNFYTGTRRNLDQLLSSPRFELLRHDICFPLYVEIDQIYNLACPASPIYYQFDPVQTTKTSVHGAINMLGLAKRLKAKILQASTSEVYGDPSVHPQTEGYWGNVNPIGPRSVYDEAKRFAEALTMAWHRTHGTDVGIVRIFNTYGPRLRPGDGRVVSNFLTQALEGRPLTVYGDGTQTRSLCFVSDEVAGILALLDSAVTGPVNIGNPDEHSMLDLARIVLEVTGSASEIVHAPLPVDDPTRRRPDITVARQQLGWEPVVDLHEGLRRTAEFFSAA
jgi:UDP-glucuronate decarboxylase